MARKKLVEEFRDTITVEECKEPTVFLYQATRTAIVEGEKRTIHHVISEAGEELALWGSSVLDSAIVDIPDNSVVEIHYKGVGKSKNKRNFFDIDVCLLTGDDIPEPLASLV